MKLLKDLLQIELDELPKDEKTWEQVPNSGTITEVADSINEFKVGEKVVFNGYSVLQVTIGEDKISLIRSGDILGIL